MGISNEELLKNIRHYQESLNKYSLNKNDGKLLSAIEKLKKLPISTSHLEDTGIGRTVNALRKLGGDVGDAAKGLVAKWKEMVVEEEEKAKKEALDDSLNTTYSTEDIDSCDETSEDVSDNIKRRENNSTSSHISSDTERKDSEKYKKDLDKNTNSQKHSSSEKKERHREGSSSHKKRKQEYSSDSEGHRPKKRHISSSSESEEDDYKERSNKSMSRRKYKSESSSDDKKYKSKKSKYSNSDSDSEDNYEQYKSKSRSSSSKSYRDSSKPKSVEKTESKKHDTDSLMRDDRSKSKHRSDVKAKRDSDYEEGKSSSKHKSKKESKPSDYEEAKVKSKHDSKSRHEKESSKSKESKSQSSRSEKHESKDKRENKSSESKEKHNHKKDENGKHDEKHKKSKDEKENGRKEKSSSSSTHKSDENGKSSSASSKHKSSSDRKKEKEKVKHMDKEKIVNGIDSGSGASFADALGMCGPVISNKNPSNKKRKSTSLASPEKPRPSSSYAKPEQYEEDEEDDVPSLLKQEPEPLNINISSLLPEITPHYKPLGIPLDSQPRRMLTQDEALSQAISNKNMRTKVYSGNKSYGKVETLFDLCVRILQDNIDALEYTGGVPYIILKPVLERATPDQLFNMEHHNPYLIEDTDDLWHLHCQKEFRTKKREELESWREMYMRCLDEREARLNAITATIKQSQDKSIPVRTTKLAYVDSFVKPPRNIARKQAKNGIIADKKPAQTPASRLSALATSGDAGKVAVPNPGSRAADRSSSSSSSAAALKPKKAPLMAKTLSLFKNRFRR